MSAPSKSRVLPVQLVVLQNVAQQPLSREDSWVFWHWDPLPWEPVPEQVGSNLSPAVAQWARRACVHSYGTPTCLCP